MREDIIELLQKIIEFCAENNCALKYEPARNKVDVTVNGTLSNIKRVEVSFYIDCYGDIDDVELYIKREDENGQFMELPYRDALLCLDDVVAKYQL